MQKYHWRYAHKFRWMFNEACPSPKNQLQHLLVKTLKNKIGKSAFRCGKFTDIALTKLSQGLKVCTLLEYIHLELPG